MSAVFEPNDESLWAQLRADVGAFLLARWQAGWFPGLQPEDAYFVRCDPTTMTPQDIAEGRTIVLVGFAAQVPAEFIVLTIVHQRPDMTAVSPPTTDGLRLPPARPNPFNPLTTLRCDLPRPVRVSLAVHDLAGHRVRSLVAGELLDAGAHQRRWDGRDQSGRALAAGVYLARLTAGGVTSLERLMLVR